MNRFQPSISFKSIADFLEFLPPDELDIVLFLRELILNELPEVTEKLSYHVPFYSLRKRICFIWPACIPWEGQNRKGVILGFSQADKMISRHHLDMGTRKTIGHLTFIKKADIHVELVLQLLHEAMEAARQP